MDPHYIIHNLYFMYMIWSTKNKPFRDCSLWYRGCYAIGWAIEGCPGKGILDNPHMISIDFIRHLWHLLHPTDPCFNFALDDLATVLSDLICFKLQTASGIGALVPCSASESPVIQSKQGQDDKQRPLKKQTRPDHSVSWCQSGKSVCPYKRYKGENETSASSAYH